MDKYFHTPEEEDSKQINNYFHTPEEDLSTKKRLVSKERLEKLLMNGLDIINIKETRDSMYVIEYRDDLEQEKESGRKR